MRNLLLATVLLMPVIVFGQIDTMGAILQEGTMVKAVLMEDISGKEVSVGQTINFEVGDDILLNDKIVIPKGSKITGTVTAAERSKALGKKGKLAFNIDFLYLANGRIIKLKRQIEKNLKGSGAAVAAGAILLSPVALFVKGKNAKYEKGEIFTAYVDKETRL